MTPAPSMRSTSTRPVPGKVVLWVAAALAVVVAGRYLDAPALLRAALDWIRVLGPWGPVIFVLLYIAATVLLLPGSALTLGAGAVQSGSSPTRRTRAHARGPRATRPWTEALTRPASTGEVSLRDRAARCHLQARAGGGDQPSRARGRWGGPAPRPRRLVGVRGER